MLTANGAKPTRLAQVKAERDAVRAELCKWQLAAAWSEGGTIARSCWRDDAGCRYEAKLVVGPRAMRALVVVTLRVSTARYGEQVPSVSVYDHDEWHARVSRAYLGSDQTYRTGEVHAQAQLWCALARATAEGGAS